MILICCTLQHSVGRFGAFRKSEFPIQNCDLHVDVNTVYTNIIITIIPINFCDVSLRVKNINILSNSFFISGVALLQPHSRTRWVNMTDRYLESPKHLLMSDCVCQDMRMWSELWGSVMGSWRLSVRPTQSSCRGLNNTLSNCRIIWRFCLHRPALLRNTSRRPWNRKMRQ